MKKSIIDVSGELDSIARILYYENLEGVDGIELDKETLIDCHVRLAACITNISQWIQAIDKRSHYENR
jgi:hypothetical protein